VVVCSRDGDSGELQSEEEVVDAVGTVSVPAGPTVN
jgi:hypothetical protein